MGKQSNRLDQRVLAAYKLKPETVRVIQGGEQRTVWKIKSPKGTFCLKRLGRPLEKVHFSIQAHSYLAAKKANVPGIFRNAQGALYTEIDGHVYVLYQWIEGRDLHLDRSDHLKKAIHGLARFHKDSIGFVPAVNCKESTKWGKWPDHYRSMLERMKAWKKSKISSPTAELYRKYSDQMIRQGEQALKLLKASDYRAWLSRSEKMKCLCHQDYGEGNALLTQDGVVVLDLDSVTYDLPLRDLRKVILKQMSERGKWEPKLLEKIIAWYTSVHSLTSDQLRILYIDCFFPHLFHDTAKNPLQKGKSISSDKMMRTVKLENEKAGHLQRLLSG
ncbi:CotS family spore coat protein [Effusibacillus lacus]|uniref:CotS family spore coat protein n=1 Tax=Effusibacillus lacus TaxID=1348429 RepID=UPI000BB8BEC8|nr:CotS family spore coat protein [Effusibacillus lacus]TCS73504.1 spore coat protein I [Effusibacillus lacus]